MFHTDSQSPVAQVSQPAVSPTSSRQAAIRRSAPANPRDTHNFIFHFALCTLHFELPLSQGHGQRKGDLSLAYHSPSSTSGFSNRPS
jgi:hypothetical protein